MRKVKSNKKSSAKLVCERRIEKRLQRKIRVRKAKLKAARRRSRRQPRALPFSSVRIPAPPIVALDTVEHYEAVLRFIKQIKQAICEAHITNVIIDLSRIERLYPDGTLLLVAEIESMLECCFGDKLEGTYPTDPVVEQLFQHIGLLQKLGLAERIETIDSEQVVDWLYVSGVEADLNSIVSELPRLLTSSANRSLGMAVRTGMSEAVANSSEHAYRVLRKDGAGFEASKKWWMFAKREGDDVNVLVCDLGAGIPGTLKETWPEELGRFLKTMIGRKREDHQMIKWAMKLGRSGTEHKHRGKGLKDIHKTVKEERVGHLVILSNKGVYLFNGSTQRIQAKSREASIHGTIVQWKIPITAFEGMRKSYEPA